MATFDGTFEETILEGPEPTHSPGASGANIFDGTFVEDEAFDPSAPFLENLDPVPGAANVPPNSAIQLTVQDDASEVVLGLVNVDVGATPAVVGGVIQPAFAGAGSGVTPSGNGYAFVLVPVALLTGSPAVHVVAENLMGGTLDTMYSFTVAAQTSPAVVPVDPLDASTAAPSTLVILDILDTGFGVDTNFTVEIDAGSGFANAYTGGAFVAPYDGPGSLVSAVAGFRVTVDPTSDFPDSQVVSVRVTASDLDSPANSVVATYSFTTTVGGTLSAASTVPNNGGTVLALEGTIPPGDYTVHVGPAGDATDPTAYNGRPGTGGATVTFVAGTGGFTAPTAPVYAPPNPIGGPYTVTFVPVPSGSTINSNPAVTVVPENFSEHTTSLRGQQPPWLAVGARRPRDRSFPQS